MMLSKHLHHSSTVNKEKLQEMQMLSSVTCSYIPTQWVVPTHLPTSLRERSQGTIFLWCRLGGHGSVGAPNLAG